MFKLLTISIMSLFYTLVNAAVVVTELEYSSSNSYVYQLKHFHHGKNPTEAIANMRADADRYFHPENGTSEFSIHSHDPDGNFTAKILGGCAKPGWVTNAILSDSIANISNYNFISCGFSTPAAGLSAVRDKALAWASQHPSSRLKVFEVKQFYDDGLTLTAGIWCLRDRYGSGFVRPDKDGNPILVSEGLEIDTAITACQGN